MTIKELLAKAAKGETLTEEERSELAAYDPDRVSNGAAAAARKAAEKERDALKAQLAEAEEKLANADVNGKSELEQLKAQVVKLTKLAADKDQLIAKAAADQKKTTRDGKIGKILSGLRLMPDGAVDPDMVRLALDHVLAGVEDDALDNADAVKPIIDGLVSKNKGWFVGDSGGGSGTPPKDGHGSGGAPLTVEGIRSMDDATFMKNKDALWAQAGKIK